MHGYRRTWLGLYVVALLFLTLVPLPRRANQLASFDHFDKVAHVVLLGGLAVMLYWNLAVTGRPSFARVVIPSALVAALIEFLQLPLPYRTADVWDFFWGVIGATVAYLIIARLPGKLHASRRE